MNLDEFNNLDPQNFGNWPIAVKAVIIALLCAAALGAGYYFDTQKQLQELTKKEREEKTLFDDFKDKQWKAATLPKLEQQLTEIEANLKDLQRKLPSKAEVAGLIQDISQQAIASGLKSELFKPDREQRGSVYVEIPIQLRFLGDYHSFGKFISGVAAMPRIVTQHNLKIKETGQDKLMMEMIAKIYRYLEEEPLEESNKKGKK